MPSVVIVSPGIRGTACQQQGDSREFETKYGYSELFFFHRDSSGVPAVLPHVLWSVGDSFLSGVPRQPAAMRGDWNWRIVKVPQYPCGRATLVLMWELRACMSRGGAGRMREISRRRVAALPGLRGLTATAERLTGHTEHAFLQCWEILTAGKFCQVNYHYRDNNII